MKPFRRTMGGKSAFAIWFVSSLDATGQSLVTERVLKFLPADTLRFSFLPGFNPQSLKSWIICVLKMFSGVAKRRIQTIYLVCSRSNGGFIRDLPAYLMRFFGVKVVVHVHGSDIISLMSRPYIGLVARLIFRRCTVIVPSNHLVEPMNKFGVSDCHVCENFVSDSFLTLEDVISPGISAVSKPYIVLWNSNVMASKGFFKVAEAVSELYSKGMKILLVAMGVPLGDELLSKECCSVQLNSIVDQPWIRYLGPVDRSESFQALSACDVVCLPSNYSSECQPLALIEAMCAGKPLLVAGTEALRSTVLDYPCEIITSINGQTIAQTLIIIKDGINPDQATSLLFASERARKRFSAERFDMQMRLLIGIDA
jgi:glycosyltransferase involved in cell wall biosynthesis